MIPALLETALSHTASALRWTMAALVVVTGATVAAAQGEPLSDEAAVNAFAFADKTTGLAIGEAGLVLRTDDGGKSWRQLSGGANLSLLAAAMVDRDTAFVAGGWNLGFEGASVGALLKTSDGGRSWQAIETASARFWGLAARGKSLAAWGESGPGNPAALLVSDDAGASWRPADGQVPAPILALRWTGDDEALAVTADGAAWQLDKRRLTRIDGQTPPGRITAAHVFDDRNWIVGLESGLPVRTADGGRSWRSVGLDGPPGSVGARAFHFHEPGEGWLVGVGPSGIQFTRDAGLKWSTVGPVPPGPLHAVWFRDAWNGLVAGPFGSIYRTTDGGAHWTPAHHAPRRAALCVIEPYGSVGDWPLVSMLSGDRGYRTVLWAATRPAGELLIVHERRLRDAAWALGGAEAMVLPFAVSSRVDGPPAFDVAETPLPHAPFEAPDATAMIETVRLVARQWDPAVVLSPSPESGDAEEAWVAAAAVGGAKARVRRRWEADPQNRTGDRLPGSRNEFPVAVNTLVPSEMFGAYHGARAHMAAQLVLDRPLPLAESLGYLRVGVERPDNDPTALLADLDQDSTASPASRRDIGATAVFAHQLRADWQRVARDFFPHFRADLDDDRLGFALGRAAEFVDHHSQLHLGQIAMSSIVHRAAASGDLPLACRAAEMTIPLSRGWPARRLRDLAWMLDLSACRELGDAAAILPRAAPKLSRYETVRAEIESQAPLLLERDDLLHQGLRLRETSRGIAPAEAIALRERLARTSDPMLRQLVALEKWVQAGRRDRPPVTVVSLSGSEPQEDEASTEAEKDGAAPDGNEQAKQDGQDGGKNSRKPADKGSTATRSSDDDKRTVDFGGDVRVNIREGDNHLYFVLDAEPAKDLWLTIDMDGDGRTLLAEPLADRSPPEQLLLVTPTAPVWVRRPKLWTRQTKDGQLALGLSYEALGGRPARRTVWLVTLRRHVLDGLRPVALPALTDRGCFAVTFD
ncbi:MAG: hypothetical protein JXL80_10600 [Planctomycetes bacterium]|nr:hypothetical protein [Planctomycetota bacterium]